MRFAIALLVTLAGISCGRSDNDLPRIPSRDPFPTDFLEPEPQATPLDSRFSIVVPEEVMGMRPGHSLGILLEISRWDGFDGSIELEVVEPPEGLSMAPALVPAGALYARIEVSATSDAPSGVHPIAIRGRTPMGVSYIEELEIEVHAAGGLDESFGSDGVRVFPDPWARGDNVVPRPGGGYFASYFLRDPKGMRLLAFDESGDPDPTFGTDGQAFLDADVRLGSALPDGGILLFGNSSASSTAAGVDAVVIRLTASGAPDPSFGGGDGVWTVSMDAHQTVAAIAVQDDGRIVVSISGETSALTRLTATGETDPSFGLEGFVPQPWSASQRTEFRSLSLDGAGGIVVGGSTVTSTRGWRPFVARFSADGVLIPEFGARGWIFLEGSSPVTNVCVDREGRILASSRADGEDAGWGEAMEVERVLADGTLDRTFGADGSASVFGGENENIHAMRVIDGKLMILRYGDGGGVVIRMNPDGTRDPSFGENGAVMLDVGEGLEMPGGAIPIEGDRYLVIGHSDLGDAAAPSEAFLLQILL